METIYQELNTTPAGIVNFARYLNETAINFIPDEYLTKIVDALKDEIAEDIHETADHENWNGADLSLALGRVLCKKLGIEV